MIRPQHAEAKLCPSLGSGKIHARSAITLYKLIVFKCNIIISSEEPEYIRSSRRLCLILLEVFEYMQASFSPILVKKC